MTAIVKRKGDYVPASLSTFFNEFFGTDPFERGLGASEQGKFVPAVNIKETDNEFQLSFVVPGMDKKNFDIVLDNDTLSVSGKVEEEKEEKRENFSRMEYSFRSFKRSFPLPLDQIKTAGIDAKYENGILNLTIPKKEEAKPQPAKTFKVK